MFLEKGDIIKHGVFMDVALLVDNVFYEGENTKILYCRWLNQGFNGTFEIAQPVVEIIIYKENMHLWSRCKNPNATCVRFEKWEQFEGAA